MKLIWSLYLVCGIGIVRVWAQEAPPRVIPAKLLEDAFEMAETIIRDRNMPEALPASVSFDDYEDNEVAGVSGRAGINLLSGLSGDAFLLPSGQLGRRNAPRPPTSTKPPRTSTRRKPPRPPTPPIPPAPPTPPTLPAPVARHQIFQAENPRTRKLQTVQEPFELATSILSQILSLTPEECERLLPKANLSATNLFGRVSRCEQETLTLNCQANDPYRTFDGSCNNLENPSRGMASSCFQRLVPQNYADGISQRRVAASGNPLPPPRSISLAIHSHANRPAKDLTHMLMAWGQFLDHDISLTPQSNSELLDCCEVEAPPPECDPIVIQETDPFYGEFGITCLSTFRSAVCSTCRYGPREQINQLSAYIDASHIYGNNINESRGLRTLDGSGTMRSVIVPEVGELLPPSFIPDEDFCSDQDPNLDCFQTGDQRANQHPALTSLHTLFVREHNRIARRFREINPSWDDETLFQETRRILAAEMQMITYHEYLPLVLGEDKMEEYNLCVLCDDDIRTKYDKDVDSTLVNEFSTAAFRFGHSTINRFLSDTRGSDRGTFLRDTFSFPFGLYTGQLEGVVGGLLASPSQTFDRYMVPDVTNHLYQNRSQRSGLDLASLNINRGRDHGIPGYATLFEFCSNSEMRDWNDLDKLVDSDKITLLRSLYERVEDIDLFTGGLLEQPVGDAVVGPTFACIIATQFQRLKFGDRFYFEHKSQAGSFSQNQRRQLRKVSLGKLICDNSGITETQKNAFLPESKQNPVEACDSKPGMNLNAWKTRETGARSNKKQTYKGEERYKQRPGYKRKTGYKGVNWKQKYKGEDKQRPGYKRKTGWKRKYNKRQFW